MARNLFARAGLNSLTPPINRGPDRNGRLRTATNELMLKRRGPRTFSACEFGYPAVDSLLLNSLLLLRERAGTSCGSATSFPIYA